MKTCGKDHSGEVSAEIKTLPDSQAGFWRHRCAGCAYLLGRRDGAQSEERLRDRVRQLMEQVDKLEAALAKK